MMVCFVKCFETVVLSMNIRLYVQLCSRPWDWQLKKKYFETCGILIFFVCFLLFQFSVATLTEIRQDNFCHPFSEFSHACLFSRALTVMQKLTKWFLLGCHFKLLFIVFLQVNTRKKEKVIF